MRLNTYLNEDITASSFNKLLPEYSEILKIYKKTEAFLYRASNRKFIFAAKTPRKMRKPKDTDVETHKKLDGLFYDKFGWKVRSEGLFTTMSSYHNQYYGSNQYIIFPKNGFKYVYNPDVRDLYTTITYFAGKGDKELKKLINGYEDKDLMSYLKKNKGYDAEVTIKCDKYYSMLIDDKNINWTKLTDWLKDLKI